MQKENYLNKYYSKQSELRGINTVEDVRSLLKSHYVIYDKILPSHLDKFKDKKVVELACGPGIFLSYLKDKGFKNYLGIDLDDHYLDLCKQMDLNITKDDAISWLENQQDNSVDVIIAIDFIEHLNKQDYMDFLELISQKLTQDGLVIFRAPNGDSPFFGLNFYNDITHFTVFTTVAHNALLNIFNLKIIDTKDDSLISRYNQSFSNKILAKLCQKLLRFIIYMAINHKIYRIGQNIWIFGAKK